MMKVVIPARDYTASKAAEVAMMKARLAQMRADPELASDADTYEQVIQATEDAPVPDVKRHKGVVIKHAVETGETHAFEASFDEVQRILLCPECGREVTIPEDYYGTP